MRMRWLVTGALVACETRAPAPPTPTPPVPVVPPDDLVFIEELPRFAEYRDARSPYDCTILSALQAYLPRTRVKACGLLERDAPRATTDDAAACVKRAFASSRPLLVAQAIQGTDSAITRASVVRHEHGRYTAYEAWFDSDPCGGGCGDAGGTRITRCDGAPALAATCYDGLAACLACDGFVVERCRHGRPSQIPLADAEREREHLLGATPASLGPALAPLELGRPFATWSTPAVRAAITRIEAGGIVSFGSEREPWGPNVDVVALDFAGPCHRVRALLEQRWGASATATWRDPAAHRRATLDLAECRLWIERYADVATWIDESRTAPVPLGVMGELGTALAARLGRPVEDERVAWRAPGIGDAKGSVEVRARLTRGRVTGLDVRGFTDARTLEELRARITALRGAPVSPGEWRGRPPIYLDHGDDGSFGLSVGN